MRRVLPFLRQLWGVLIVGVLVGVLGNYAFAWLRGEAVRWQETAGVLRQYGFWILLPMLALGVLTLLGWWDKHRAVDITLGGTATVKRARELVVGTDIILARYRVTPYVWRTADDAARTAFDGHGGVIIIGRPKSGKTRLAYELLRWRQNALVIIPHADRPPSPDQLSGLARRDVILFFDDLHQGAETRRPLEWRERVQSITGRPCPLVCTTRDGKDWDRVKDQQGRLLDALGRDAGYVFTSRVGDRGADLTESEGLRLARALGRGGAFQRRFDGTPGSLLLDLTAMRERYERLQREALGAVLMSRLLDAAKLLHVARQPHLHDRQLRSVAERIRGDTPLSAETWEAVRRRTMQEGFGQFDRDGELLIYRPYLEQCVTYEPGNDDLGALLAQFVEDGDGEELFYLAVAANQLDPALAMRAFEASAALHFMPAYNNLGVLLARRPGREQEAERAYRVAAAGGIVAAYSNLGALLSRLPGREAEAEEALRVAADNGEATGWFNFGLLLAGQPGREREAEAAYHAAAAGGVVAAYLNLGTLLSQQAGRDREAEEAFRTAMAGGEAKALSNLGILLADQPGREEEAEDGEGDVDAWFHLGLLLADQAGRESEAKEALKVAAAGGNVAALRNLGLLLADLPGREREAEEALRGAANRGEEQAWFALGNLLARQPGSEQQAEEAFRTAPASETGEVFTNLGALLARQPGREREAEDLYRSAIARGDTAGWLNLGLLLIRDPERQKEGCEALRKAQASNIRQVAMQAIIVYQQRCAESVSGGDGPHEVGEDM